MPTKPNHTSQMCINQNARDLMNNVQKEIKHVIDYYRTQTEVLVNVLREQGKTEEYIAEKLGITKQAVGQRWPRSAK